VQERFDGAGYRRQMQADAIFVAFDLGRDLSTRAPVHLACWSVCLGGVPAWCFPVLRAILSPRGMVQAYVASQSVLRSGAVLDTRMSSCLLWPLRMELGEASTAYPEGRGGDRAPCSAGTAAQRLVADAEGLNAPAGNTGPCAWARRGRSVGVLRPRHAGRGGTGPR
jgi:hypothetical protein